MMLVASTLFALLEASRFYQIKGLTKLQTQVALESIFAEYNTHLWEQYRILACSQEFIEENIENYGNRQIIENDMGTNFYQFRVKQVELLGYTRLTDGGGDAFIQAAAGYMEKNVLQETAKVIYNQYEGIKNIQDGSGYSFQDIGQAVKELEKSEKTQESEITDEGIKESQENQEIHKKDISRGTAGKGKNLLEWIESIQEKGILSLVLKEEELSDKEFCTTDKVSNRDLPEGYNPNLKSLDWYSRILFQQYILTYLSNYTDEKTHTMNYEVEYLLSGKDSDIENLKGTVTRLLAIRTAANFLYLSNNIEKQEQAGILALSIAGVSANPILVETVKTAIVTAWAFAESVLDIRTLLTGGKIALLKSETSWTLDIDDITKLNDGYPKAKNCKDGLSYEEYLGILLLLQSDKVTAMRTMDVQEQTLREMYGDKSIKMEDWMIELKASVSYGYHPVFFSIQRTIPSWNYEIVTTGEFAY